MRAPCELSLVEAAAAIRDLRLSSVALVESCLGRIDASEGEVRAWVTDGLPLGTQLIGAPFAEARLLAAARWVEAALGFAAVPPA
jgi:Asp-tRNA(Asn)/Glu-tRNA(Gln) amidotransferase A subunit family amidase